MYHQSAYFDEKASCSFLGNENKRRLFSLRSEANASDKKLLAKLLNGGDKCVDQQGLRTSLSINDKFGIGTQSRRFH